jgi:DNA-binding protein HU-beta
MMDSEALAAYRREWRTSVRAIVAAHRAGRNEYVEESMNKADLVDSIESKLGGKKVATDALEAVLDIIIREVAKGGKVAITGFGTFQKVAREARTGRNPRTGETVRIRKTTVPRFRPGTRFKVVVADPRKLPKTSPAAARATAGGTSGATARTAPPAKKAAPAKRTAPAKTAARKATATTKPAATKAPAGKAPAGKAPAGKAPAGKATTTGTVAKKATTKTAAKKATPARAAAKKSAARATSG